MNKLIILNLLSYEIHAGARKLIEPCSTEPKFACLKLRELEPTHPIWKWALFFEALARVVSFVGYGAMEFIEHVVLPSCLYTLFVYNSSIAITSKPLETSQWIKYPFPQLNHCLCFFLRGSFFLQVKACLFYQSQHFSSPFFTYWIFWSSFPTQVWFWVCKNMYLNIIQED